MRILVVDDDYVSRSKLKALLAQYGDCDAASTGQLAVELFQQAYDDGLPYELVTMDVELGDCKGQAVTSLMREYEDTKGVKTREKSKILMISVKQDMKNVAESYAKGCEGYLQKPVSPENLAAALSDLGISLAR